MRGKICKRGCINKNERDILLRVSSNNLAIE